MTWIYTPSELSLWASYAVTSRMYNLHMNITIMYIVCVVRMKVHSCRLPDSLRSLVAGHMHNMVTLMNNIACDTYNEYNVSLESLHNLRTYLYIRNNYYSIQCVRGSTLHS